jgi:hypothetical protein
VLGETDVADGAGLLGETDVMDGAGLLLTTALVDSLPYEGAAEEDEAGMYVGVFL